MEEKKGEKTPCALCLSDGKWKNPATPKGEPHDPIQVCPARCCQDSLRLAKAKWPTHAARPGGWPGALRHPLLRLRQGAFPLLAVQLLRPRPARTHHPDAQQR